MFRNKTLLSLLCKKDISNMGISREVENVTGTVHVLVVDESP